MPPLVQIHYMLLNCQRQLALINTKINSESSNEPALFEVNEEAAARMEALLHAAEQQAVMGTENTSRVTRSQGAEFRWNPK